MVRGVVICFVHDQSLYNPTCWCRCRYVPNLSSGWATLLETFPGNNCSVVPLQFSHLLTSLLFDILMRYPSFQFVDTCPSSRIFLNGTWTMFEVTSVFGFNVSTDMLSGSSTFPLLICLMAVLIPSIVCRVTSKGRFVRSAAMSVGFNEAGLFESLSKYSTHLFLCSSVSVIGFTSLFLTNRSDLLYFPALVLSLIGLPRTSACRLKFSFSLSCLPLCIRYKPWLSLFLFDCY